MLSNLSSKAKRWIIAAIAAVVVLLGVGFGYYKTVPGTDIPVPQDSIEVVTDSVMPALGDSLAVDTVAVDSVK